MTDKPRLLIVGGFPDPGSKIIGGIVASCRNLMGSSLPDRFDIATVDSTQVQNPPPGFWTRLRLARRRMGNFYRSLRQHRPHAVLLFTSSGASLLEKGLMSWICVIHKVPVLLFPRSGIIMDQFDRSRMWRTLIRFCFRGASVILCQGSRWQDFVTTKLGRPKEQAPIIFNWTATEELLAIGRRRITSRSDGPSQDPLPAQPRLIFMGWLEYKKGIFEMLEALEALEPNHAFSLTIAGDGHVRNEAEARVRGSPLADRVEFCGWITPDKVPDLLAAHDVLVLPSWAEGMPNAMIEAMAAGLTVVVTSVGNIPDVIRHRETGLLVPPRDADALQTALAEVLTDPDLRQNTGKAAHARAQDLFSTETAVGHLARVFGTLENIKRIESEPHAD